MIPRPLAMAATAALTALALYAGCDTPKAQGTRETLKKTTQEVRNVKEELGKGDGAFISDGKIHETDYLGQNAAAYRTSVAAAAKMRVDMDMTAYELESGSKPKSYEEFMEKIIKKGDPKGIQLPMLPYYQEYGYDPDKQELVVIEYPAKKKAVEEKWDKDVGRK
jgi:hypothetical protein